MNVNEIVREQKLDEALPLAIPMAISAVMFGLKAMSVYEMYDILSKNGFDIDNMSEDDKVKLFIELIIMFVPGGGRFANATIMKFLPAWAKRRGAKIVGDKLLPMAKELRAMKNANRKKYATSPSTSPAKAAKNQKELGKANRKLDATYQAAGKQIAAEKLKDVAYTVVGGLALLPLSYTYYGKLDDLDKQYTAHKNGDTATELFGNMDANAAYQEYSKLRAKYIGELTLGVAAAISRTPVGKLVDNFTKITSVGGLIKLPLTLANKIAKMGGPALAVMMQTEAGQKFLSSSIVEAITRGVGYVSNATINLLALAVDSALGAVGIKSNLQKATAAQAAPPGVDTVQKGDIYGLEIKTDPKNPNIKYISGQQVTDQDGYLRNNIPNVIDNITTKAKGLGMPNPLDQIKKNPNLQYPAY